MEININCVCSKEGLNGKWELNHCGTSFLQGMVIRGMPTTCQALKRLKKKWQNPKPPTVCISVQKTLQLNKWQQWNMYFCSRCAEFHDHTEEKHLTYPDWSARFLKGGDNWAMDRWVGIWGETQRWWSQTGLSGTGKQMSKT